MTQSDIDYPHVGVLREMASYLDDLREQRPRWRRIPAGHRVINPADPDLRTIADVGFALGLRFHLVVRKRWLGPWRLIDSEWRRYYGDPENPYVATLRVGRDPDA